MNTFPAIAYNNYLYTVGGYDGSSQTTTVFYTSIGASSTLGTWTTTAPLPSKLSNLAIAASNGYLYVTGGYDGAYTSTVLYAPLNSTGSISQWYKNPYSLPAAIAGHASLIYNGYLYTIGGYDGAVTSSVFYAPLTASSAGNWTTTTPLPSALRYMGAAASNDRLYVLGGNMGSTANTSTVLYAPINSTGSLGNWKITTALPTTLRSFGTYLYNGFLYTTGGEMGGATPTPTSSVFYASIRTDLDYSLSSWISSAPLPSNLYLHAGAAYNGYIYTIAGSPASGVYTSTIRSAPLYTSCTKFTAVAAGNIIPTVTSVSVNNASSVVLIPNATTSVNVNAVVADDNGCSDITNGTTTILLYRSSITSSTCLTAQNNLNCYKLTAFTASSTCSVGSINTTTTFDLWYFADATDSSSSFPNDDWQSTVIFKDVNGGIGSGDSVGGSGPPDVLTLTAINVTTSSINYGTVGQGADTGSVNQVATTTNAGNSSTTLQLRALQTLTSGADSIPTSSQRYSTSSFTFPGTSTALTESLVTVSGFFLVPPTSTNPVQQPTFWGLSVPATSTQTTYYGTTVFSSLWQQ
jgi:hypothetical protein